MSPGYSEKLQRAHSHLAALGLPRSTIAPPIYRAAWNLGVEIPPPLLASFALTFVAQAALFALLWGPGMVLLVRLAGLPIPPLFVGVGAIVAGLAFGLVMALFLRRKARQLSLPPWESF